MSEIDIFRQYMLTKDDVELGEPATEDEIAAFETLHNIKFPADIREYFLKINGVYEGGGWSTIEALKDWGIITHIPPYSEGHISSILPDADEYFRFGFYDISVWNWSIKLAADLSVPTPIVVTHEKSTKIANNFSDFLRLYLTTDAIELLGYSTEFYPDDKDSF